MGIGGQRTGRRPRAYGLSILTALMMIVSALLPAGAAFAGPSPTGATIASDLADYNPGGTVTLTGAGWAAGEQVRIVTNDTLGQTWQRDVTVTADPGGNVSDIFQLPNYFVSDYDVTATGPQSGAATTTFTDANPAADLDQCANDQAPSPSSDGCNTDASQWVNGNLGASKAVYFEGDSIPYRIKLSSLSLASHTITIEWDTTKSSTHALDYLTSFDRTVATANPCLGVAGCNAGTFTTFPIPADPQVTGAGVTPIAGVFTFYGGTITAVSAYSYLDGAGFSGDKSARITLTFTASVANPVLAWGGHISSRQDWGANNSAVSISGSPYHTRLIDLDGSGGNQDRSLSADAVIFPGSITVVKDATPNSSTSFGFTASPSPLADFSLVDDGTNFNTKIFGGITNFQTYSVNESSIPSGWGFDSVSCAVTTPNGGSYTTNTTTVNVNMNEGENWTCTYLDSQRTGTLTVIKHVVNDNGGTATADAWSLHVKSGGSDVSGSPQAGSESGTQYTLNAGAYAVGETGGPSGYTFTGFSGDCDSSGNVTVVAGQNKTCTLTNNDQTAHLKLVKVVTNDNGGTAATTDFTLSASGPTPISGAGGADSDVSAGTYTLSETGPAGYSTAGYDCGSSVTLALGESKTCTITNNDIAPKLHLRKVVTNDNGGTATVADFTLTADGTGSNDLSGTSPVDSGPTLKADTFALSETAAVSGYSAGAWSCDAGSLSGSNLTLGIGQEATCTITNDDQAAHLKLIKVVKNDDGGSAVVTDFTLSASGPTPISGAGGVDSAVSAGAYTLSETNLPGYTAGAWTCTGGTFDGTSKITLALGESATCSITNDDQPAYITVTKVVVNDNGGTAQPNDFALTLSGNPVNSGVQVKVNPGTYTAGETQVSGYSFTGFSGDCDSSGKITVALGQSKTCTLTNNDIAPKLHLRKYVVNDNGGTATTADFTLTADGTGSNDLSGSGSADSGVGLQADTWALSETGPSGYATSGWSCTGGTQSGSNITVGIGGEATCTITNNDIAPVLHLRKVVKNDNGGTATTADFTLTANGTGSNDISGVSPVDSGAGLKADTFALSETTKYGYTASAWSCSGGTQSASNITLGIGQEATCTITNDDNPGTIVIVKNATPQQGTFTFNTTGTTSGPGTSWPASFTLTGDPTNNGNKKSFTVDAGSYGATESPQLSWTLTGIGNPGDSSNQYNCVVSGSGGSTGTGDLSTGAVSISIKNGDTVTCYFENTGNGATRTQGFWATHPELASQAWFGGTTPTHSFPGVAGVGGIGDAKLCPTITGYNGTTVGKDINTLGRLMGGFWSDVSKTSTSKKRSPIDQARMQLLQQMLAAELNASAFGSVPSGGTAKFGQWEAAYCGNDQNAIKNAQSQAAAFNSQGDNSTFTPGASANSQFARSIADKAFWDVLP